MAWINGPLRVYHGTDDISGLAIMKKPPSGANHSIKLTKCAAQTDFGRGFYLTTSLAQAENWANVRYKTATSATQPSPACAVVLAFDVDRDALAALEDLDFVLETSNADYWDFVRHCRGGRGLHRPGSRSSTYDVVSGPVSLWPQTLVIKDCDQFSFHTSKSLAVLPAPSMARKGTPTL